MMPKGGSFFGPSGLRLVFDRTDPDTPCMVYHGELSATFWCAHSMGEVDGYELSQEQYAWLDSYASQASDFDIAIKELAQL